MINLSNAERIRPWVIRWLYCVVMGHLLIGILLPWIGNLSIFDSYHRSLESGFWTHGAPAEARAQQVWWISLFGPTVQELALCMVALTRIGDRQRTTFVWIWLIIGVIVWAPQDMMISLRAGAWMHVWLDCFALITMLPPLIWLWWYDQTHPLLKN